MTKNFIQSLHCGGHGVLHRAAVGDDGICRREIGPEDTIDGIKAKDWAAYVGRSPMYYLMQFFRMSITNRKAAVCLSAFLFGPAYLFYRKMWKEGLLTALLSIVLSVPSLIAIVATFNPSLAYRYAEAVGEECRAGGIEVLLGPGMNIYRNSQNGRNFEYMGEDPLLASAMVAEYVKGMQSTGTVACLKHFICNETEFYRRRSNSIVDERALHELYLPPFKAGIDAGVGYVMTSYNRHGAVAASANVATMVNILQGEWGFHGYNVTDFTGVSLKAAPKESLMAGTTNFCGFGASVDYWNAEALSGDRAMLLAIKNDIHNALYALANSAMLNGVKSTTVVSTVEVMTPWRVAYTACEYAFGALAALSFVFWVVSKATSKGGKKA